MYRRSGTNSQGNTYNTPGGTNSGSGTTIPTLMDRITTEMIMEVPITTQDQGQLHTPLPLDRLVAAQAVEVADAK